VQVRITSEAPWSSRRTRRLRRLLERALRRLEPGLDLELSVALMGEQEIRELNRKYLDRDEVTDVLSFPQLSGEEIRGLRQEGPVEGRPEPVGDIAVCLTVARRQAAERGLSEAREVELLATHGLLHLLGYEDETESGAKMMAQKEAELLGSAAYSEPHEAGD
jgi:probable rRNA maturation factor